MNVSATTRPAPGRAKSAAASLVIMLLTGAVILAAAYLSNPGVSAGDNSADGGVTPVSVSGNASGAAPALNAPAPDFSALTADGSSLRLSDLRGQPVWLTFGASWCQACRAENADVEAVYQQVAGDVAVVQVFMDEDASAVSDYAQRVGISYVTVPDPNEQLSAEYRILGIPTHFFIDAQGVLRQIKVGSLGPAAMQTALADLRD